MYCRKKKKYRFQKRKMPMQVAHTKYHTVNTQALKAYIHGFLH